MFQFVALGLKARNAGKCEHPIRRLVLSALPLHLSNEAFPLIAFYEMTNSYARLDLFTTRSTSFRPFHIPQGVHLITELTESVQSKPRNSPGYGPAHMLKVVTVKDDLHQAYNCQCSPTVMLDTACISPIQSVCAMYSFGLQKSILAYLHSSFITFKHLNRSHYNGPHCVPMHSFTVLTYSKSKAFGYKWNESTSTSITVHFEKWRHETSS